MSKLSATSKSVLDFLRGASSAVSPPAPTRLRPAPPPPHDANIPSQNQNHPFSELQRQLRAMSDSTTPQQHRSRRRVASPPAMRSDTSQQTSVGGMPDDSWKHNPSTRSRQPSVAVSPLSTERLPTAKSFSGPADDDQRVVQRLYGLSENTVTESMLMSAASAATSASWAGEGRSKMLEAVQSRLLALEEALANQMNLHVRDRGQLSIETERAKYETENMEYCLTELQTSAEVMQRSLKERIHSRVATLKQLREDASTQATSLMNSELRSLPALHRQEVSDGALLQRMHVLRTMMSQFETHQQVQMTAIEHTTLQSLQSIKERFAAVHHVVDTGLMGSGSGRGASPRRQDGVSSMIDMITRFAVETRGHLADLRAERMAFEEHFVERFSRMLT